MVILVKLGSNASTRFRIILIPNRTYASKFPTELSDKSNRRRMYCSFRLLILYTYRFDRNLFECRMKNELYEIEFSVKK